MRQKLLIGVAALALALMAGCYSGDGGVSEAGGAGGADGSEGSSVDAGMGGSGGDAPDSAVARLPESSVTGRVVNEAGEPLMDLRILCCSHSICYTESTDEDGRYLITGIDPADVYKMQAADPMQVYSSLYYYQEIVAGEVTDLPRDVILPRRVSEVVAWSVADGGRVTLAEGVLELIAEAGTLEFPIGLEEQLNGDRIPGTILPPYTEEPWSGRAEELIVFTFNPGPITATSPIRLRATVDGAGEAGAQWQIYSINPDTAAPDDVGTATVGADGVLASDDDAMLMNILTVILVPVE